MKKIFLLSAFSIFIFQCTFSQSVGIGTTEPKASFNVAVNKTVLFGDDTTTTSHTNKLIWLPAKGALRVGRLSSSDTVGLYSTVLGYFSAANGEYSIAAGLGSIAGGSASTALGDYTAASGAASTALGVSTTASGLSSLAAGYSSYASGEYSTAMGYFSAATGEYSTAMGYSTTASGNSSTAMGYRTNASGAYSTALGYGANTNGFTNSFCIGGGVSPLAPYIVQNDANFQMMMYFNNYKFWSSTVGTGVQLLAGGNAWVSMSDKNKKENFQLLDGETVLKKISAIPFSSWNYKGQDAKTYRHYGIMAQDFYTAFGKDKYGIIGNDTTVNPIDMIGVNMAAIKALGQRTEKIEALQNENIILKNENASVKKQLQELSLAVAEMKKQMTNLVSKKNNTGVSLLAANNK
ncbi:MAG: tail fiber domain-containing protein [Bacteroidota bacterium]